MTFYLVWGDRIFYGNDPTMLTDNFSLQEPDDAFGSFKYVFALASDGINNLYLSGSTPDQVRKRDKNGVWSVFANSGTDLGKVGTVTGIAIGSDESVYLADSANHRIQKYSPTRPVASPLSLSTPEDASLSIALSASDPSGNPLSVDFAIDSNPAHGSLSGSPPSLSYAPNLNYNGSDSFTYHAVYEGVKSSIATVAITVTPVNDPPVAIGDSYSTREDTNLIVSAPGLLANDHDIDGDTLAAVLDANPSHGSVTLNADGSFVYAPNPNYNGSDSFAYHAKDAVSSSATATVNLNIIAVNDPPVASGDSYSTLEDTKLTVGAPGVLANDHDVEGDALSAVLATGPSHGSITLNADGSFAYVPGANYNGQDSFAYRARDASSVSEATTVQIAVTPVNDPPVATSDSYSTREDAPLTVAAPGVLANDQDIDGDSLAATLVSGPSHGTVTLNADGSFSYSPNPDFNGSDSFSYRADDASSSSGIATVSLTITPVNDAPVAVGDSYSTSEDATLAVASPGVLANDSDIDGDHLTATLVTGPSHGTVTLNADGSLSYSPAANYDGPDSFTYHARDASASSATATVRITVTPVNDPPVATSDSYSTPEDTTLAVAAPGVLANDQDIDGDTLAATLVTGPSRGTVTLNADGSFSYSPAANYNGSDSFSYRANDASSSSGIATVTLTITPVNDAPVATDLSVLAFAGQATDFALSASDVDGDPLTYRIVSSPAHGLLSGTPPDLSYQPDDGFLGSDAFAFAASDGSLDSAPATATIRVARPLLTLGGSLSVAAGESVVLPIAVTSDATDVAGLDLTLRATASPEAAPSLSPSFALAEATAGWSAISDPSDPWRIAIVSASGLAGPAQLLRLTARAPRDAPLGATYRIEATEATLSDSKGGVSDASGMTAPAKITVAACEERPKGDLNHDGRASLGDAVLALRIVVLNDTPENECARAAADVNCDGSIGLGDVVLILRKVALGEPFPCD